MREWIRDLSRGGRPSCSSLSVLEVAAGARPSEEALTVEFLSSLEVVVPDTDIAWRAGKMMRQYALRGTASDLVDAVIAATCMARGLSLATFNRRHDPMPEIRFARSPGEAPV